MSYKPEELLFRLAEEGPAGYKRDLVKFGFLSQETLTSPLDVTANGVKMIEIELERLIDNESES